MLKFAKAIGGNTDLLTAQAFLIENSSNVACIISGAGEDVFAKIRLAGTQIEEKFFEADAQNSQRLLNLLSFLKTQLVGIENLKILLVLWQENIMYILSSGNHKAYLFKKDEVSELTKDIQDGQLVSGFIEPEDKILLLSSKTNPDPTKNQFWSSDLVSELIKSSLDNLEAEISLHLGQMSTPEPIAAILGQSYVDKIDESSNEIPVVHLDQKNGVKVKLFKGFSFLTSFIRPKKEQSLNQTSDKNKKIKVALSLLAFLILVLGISWTLINTRRQNNNNQFTVLLNSAQEKYKTAQNLKDLDPEQSQKNLDESKKLLDQALGVKPNDQRALTLKQELDKNTREIQKMFDINNWSVYLSLDLIKTGFKAKKLSFSLGNILVLDENEGSLVLVDLKQKKPTILAGQTQLGKAKFTALNGDSAFIYSEDKGVVKVDVKKEKVTQVIKKDDDWGLIAGIFGFSGNIYLLDSLKNQIWKYVPIAAGYSDRTNYIKLNQKINLEGASGLQIDYSVWVLKQGSEILKFTAGSPDFFSIGGLDKPITSIKSFFVTEDKDTLYILDSDSSRVVVLKKNGSYIKQLVGEKFKTASDFVVDEADKKLYLLENNNIYQVELK